MTDTMTWILQFQSQGLPAINQTIRNTTKEVAQLERSVNRLGTTFQQIARGLTGFGFPLASWGTAIGALTEKISEFGKFSINVFAQKERILRTYTTILGSATDAEKEYLKAAKFSQKTDLTFEQVQTAQSGLISAGYRNDKKDRTLDRALYTIADLAAGKTQEQQGAVAGNLTRVLSALQGRGYIQEGVLNRQLVNAGVNSRDFRESVAKQLKISVGDVGKALKDRKVTADIGLAAIQEATLKKYGTTKIGEFATQSAGSISGMLSNLAEAPANILRSLNTAADMPNLKNFKDWLTGVNTTISNLFGDEKGKIDEKGAKIRRTIGSIADFIIEIFTAVGNFFSGFFESFSETFDSLSLELGLNSKKSAKSGLILSETFKNIGDVIGKIVAPAIVLLMKTMEELANYLKGFTSVLKSIVDAIGWLADKLLLPVTILKANAQQERNLHLKEMETSFDYWPERKKDIEVIPIIGGNPRGEMNRDYSFASSGLSGKKTKDLGQVLTWTPEYGSYKVSKEPDLGSKPHTFQVLQSPLNMMTLQAHQQPQIQLPKMKWETTININGTQQPDVVAQKVQVELTRIIGRLNANPTPGVL